MMLSETDLQNMRSWRDRNRERQEVLATLKKYRKYNPHMLGVALREAPAFKVRS